MSDLVGTPLLHRLAGVAALPPGKLRILCVHGVGDHRTGDWKHTWQEAMQDAVLQWNASVVVEPLWVEYDDIVQNHGVGGGDYAEALLRLGWSGLRHGVSDFFSGIFGRRRRGLSDIPEAVRWSAGMVAQWAAQEEFRADTRGRLLKRYNEEAGNHGGVDAIFAHSLGSLVTYDTLLHNKNLLADGVFVSFGSQIGNPFVRGTFGGYLRPLKVPARWYHLFNPEDRVLTADVRVRADNFKQVLTGFDSPGILNHDADRYLSHENAVAGPWRALVLRELDKQAASPTPGARRLTKTVKTVRAVFDSFSIAAGKRKPTTRAVLVGINQYPNPEDRLDGCVNDVFKMSAVLQEMSFGPDEIRVVLDERATSAGIRERLDWLLNDARPGDTRVFYYSGHGAQIPAYGMEAEPDHIDECLVPADFDWNDITKAITDDELAEYYSNLPYVPETGEGVIFTMILDCCHSGGMVRAGAAPKARGLTPPDDIRHRAIRWNRELNMWEPRDLRRRELDPVVDRRSTKGAVLGAAQFKRREQQILGSSGMLHRIGGAAPLRWRATEDDEAATRPYMPLILQACQEDELAYEYRHGVESYGAFTWTLTSALADPKRGGKQTFSQLIKETARRLKDQRYDQEPDLRGPTALMNAVVPWRPPPSSPPAAPSKRKRSAARSSQRAH